MTVNYIAKWDGSSWSALGTGLNGYVYSLTHDSSGNLYAGGRFTSAGGIAVNGLAKWDGSSWSDVGPGFVSDFFGVAIHEIDHVNFDRSRNLLYVCGHDEAWEHVFCGRWDGSSWSSLGVFNASVQGWAGVLGGAIDQDGNFYAVGEFDIESKSAIRVAKFNGTSWSDLKPPSTGIYKWKQMTVP